MSDQHRPVARGRSEPTPAPAGRTPQASNSPGYSPWLHRFSVVVVIATFGLLLAGGNVTSKNAGMAVPDWPLSFQSVNPQGWTSNFNGSIPGVRDEHGHRLIGATVGFLVTVLTIWLVARDPRRWVKLMGIAAFVAVVLQGVIGGLRVWGNSIPLAIVHGCFAQAFLCLTVAIAVLTSRAWMTDIRRLSAAAHPSAAAGDDTGLVWSTGATVLVIYMQLILGAVLRHTGWTWIPHMGWAMIVGLSLMTVARYIFQHPYAKEVLATPLIVVFALYALQVVLGFTTLLVIYPMWSQGTRVPQNAMQDWLPTVHLGFGAAILGTAAYLAVRAIGIGRQAQWTAARPMQGVPA